MSMREYGFSEYCLVIDANTLDKYLLNLKINEPWYTERKTEIEAMADSPEREDARYDLICDVHDYAMDIGICYVSEFSGDAFSLMDNGDCLYDDTSGYNSDYVLYVPANPPQLFKAAYANMDELVEDMKRETEDLLPDDFPIREHLCHLCGTYYA